MHIRKSLATGLLLTLALGGCSRGAGEIDATGGIVKIRSACPRVGIPANTGDVTLFDPAGSTDARAIDVVGVITDLRSTCDSSGKQIYTNATFTVTASRARGGPARTVTFPYFSVVVRGASQVDAKRIGQVVLNFGEGQTRASAKASAGAYVDKDAATLPADIQKEITRDRKAGDFDAAVDPLSKPNVKAAIARTSFELLVGFNLTQDQLRYNATR